MDVKDMASFRFMNKLNALKESAKAVGSAIVSADDRLKEINAGFAKNVAAQKMLNRQFNKRVKSTPYLMLVK